ncbi:MAG TPA: alpha-amylase/4-alpha-glucanotransferase domain-containing protein [Gemmatimonadales bacterium]|nr:alpha-amylase/4-alpha-glucanotransferase domain-containing protein [Gemmatimonadales bacterium]
MEPIRFAFGLHLHQPVGNFGSVFEQHVADVYRPVLREMVGAGCAPVTLHLSGPLLDWLLEHDAAYLDELGRLVTDGKVELLLAGYDEPILAVLPREDRLEQIGRMREALQRHFGVEATGLWLTERVWEPDLTADLHDAGVRYALVDDRHFTVTGIERRELHRPWRTEHGGKSIALFAIDESLRYLVPFRPATELADYLRDRRAEGQPLAVLADDGEKFGGWPGTRAWVYERGWLQTFLQALDRLRSDGEVRLVTFSQALDEVPAAGLTYLPSASYREMEGWALPLEAARRLGALERELGEERMKGSVSPLVRGSHWRHFLVKYPESNRMHKKMLALSAMARDRGDPPAARRAIGRAQCNDVYWHGVFGGLYLPHLREAVWRELARAEALLREGQAPAFEWRDTDLDGTEEIWVHSSRCSVVLSPARGGAVEELTSLDSLVNHAATLTRRREVYHLESPGGEESAIAGGAPADAAPVDREPRAILQERVWPADLSIEGWMDASAVPLHSFARESAGAQVQLSGDGITVAFRFGGLEKRITVSGDGSLAVELRWEPHPGWPADAWFTSELSLFRPVSVTAPGAREWRYPIETVAQSEKGLDRTVQGESLTLGWPAALGRARFRLALPDPLSS